MRVFKALHVKSMCAVLLALALCMIPATSRAAVIISVGFAPPVLPVYVQPPCPQPGYMWTPGYWAYGPDGYYWVDGAWVPAPEPGLYWTPGYWGFGGGLYAWHPGYWGPTVGYYGGVNYGFGFFGIGFVGGMWHGREFAYNTAVVHVNGGVIHNVYVDRTVIVNHTVVNNHVAFSGGPGGVNHPPTAGERAAMNEHHFAATSFQTQHENQARGNANAYASHNGGHPQNFAGNRPAGGNAHPATNGYRPGSNPGNAGHPENHPAPPQSHSAPQPQTHESPHPQPQEHESHPQPQSHPQSHEDHGHYR